MYSVAEVAFLLKMTFWPLWPQIYIWSISLVEGLKLMNMYEFYGHAV